MNSSIPAAPVHPEGNAAKSIEPLRRQVPPLPHGPHDGGEGEEVLLPGAEEGLGFEEGNDPPKKIVPVPHDENQRGVLGPTVVLDDPSTAKPIADQVQDLTTLRALADMELRHELRSASRALVPLDGHVEGTLSVHETRNVGIQPFLLIVRTWRIFTVHATDPTQRV